MDGLKIKVTLADGTVDETFELTPRMIVEFEQKFSKGFGKLLGEDQKFEHIYFLAWLALRINGKGPKPFGLDFIDTLSNAELVTDPFTESTPTL